MHLGSSKKIAISLGKSRHTVDHHLRAAIARLGVTDRDDAAELVRRADSQDLTSQSYDLATPLRSDNHSTGPTRTGGADGRSDGNVLREERVEFGGFSRQSRPFVRAQWWNEIRGAKQTPAERMKWILLAMLASAVALLVMIAVAESLNRTLLHFSDLIR
jgi:hypothetical protein